jgi:hypothetical protein
MRSRNDRDPMRRNAERPQFASGARGGSGGIEKTEDQGVRHPENRVIQNSKFKMQTSKPRGFHIEHRGFFSLHFAF